MSRQVIIRCDHCNKEVDSNYKMYRVHSYDLDRELDYDLDKELELCNECSQKFRDYIMDFIQPKHYKY